MQRLNLHLNHPGINSAEDRHASQVRSTVYSTDRPLYGCTAPVERDLRQPVHSFIHGDMQLIILIARTTREPPHQRHDYCIAEQNRTEANRGNVIPTSW